MKHRLLYACLTTTLLVLAACTPAPEPAPEPVDTTEADIAAIRANLDPILAAWNAGDSATGSSFFTEDAVQMPPDGPNSEGRQAIQQAEQDFHDQYTAHQAATMDDVGVDGDLAFALGTWSVSQTPTAGGEEQQRNGKWLTILKRQPDGSWKTFRHMWNEPVEDEDSD